MAWLRWRVYSRNAARPKAGPASLQETSVNRRSARLLGAGEAPPAATGTGRRAGLRIDAVERPPPAARAHQPVDRRAVPGRRLLVRPVERVGALPQPGVTGLVPHAVFHRERPQRCAGR